MNQLDNTERGALVNSIVSSLSRRSFLKGTLGMTALVSAGFLAGCGGGGGSDTSDGGAATGANIIRFGVAKPDASFDTQTTSTTIGISENVTEGLYELDPVTTEVKPVIAKALPTVSEDGLTYEIELNEGVKFHDGTELTADDVKFTFERLVSINAEADSFSKIEGFDALASGEATELTGLTVVDPTHVTFKLSEPHSSFLRLLCQFYANIYPKAGVEAAGDDWGISTGTDYTTFYGCGPFMIAENDGVSFVRLAAFDDYHAGRPAIDAVEINYVSDDSTLMNMYVNGDLDVVFLPKDLLAQYTADPTVGAEIVNYTPCATQFVNLNLQNGPAEFQDQRVREALSLAIDRQTLCDTVLEGAAAPCSCFIPGTVNGHDDTLEVFEFNPDKARELLSQAGVSGLTFDFPVRKRDELVAQVLASNWNDVGVTANVSVIEDQDWSTKRGNGEIQATTVTWSSTSNVGIEFMSSFFLSSESVKRSSFYSNPEFDELTNKAKTTTDLAEADEFTKQADNVLTRQDYGTLPIDWPQNPYCLKPGFSGLEVLVDFHFKHVVKA
jgi:peptide/nickel transport system substrate-binding protein